MSQLKAEEKKYWDSYVKTLLVEEKPIDPIVTAAFAGNAEITDVLLKLYLNGKKSAGSSIVEDFISAGDELPKVGNYWIFLNSQEIPSCILKTEKIVLNKFFDVPEEIAIAEGEGDLSLAYWRKVHSDLYEPHLASWGLKSLDDATVITEFFKLVYQK